jgi:hypothetical protein
LAENKIPVLTEIYQPKKEVKSAARKESPLFEITPALIAKIAAEIRPQIENEIKESLQNKLRSDIEAELKENLKNETSIAREAVMTEVQQMVDTARHDIQAARDDINADKQAFEQARASSLSETRDFLDKAKADLKTELPAMYQQTIDLAQVNLTEKFALLEKEAQAKFDEILSGSVQTISNSGILKFTSELESLHDEKSSSISKQLEKDIQAFQKKALAENEALVKSHAELAESLNKFFLTSGQKMEKEFSKNFQEFQTNLLAEHQQRLNHEADTLAQNISKRFEDSAQEQLALIDTQVGTMQQDNLAQLRERFNAEKTEIYNAVAAEIKTTFTEQMSAKGEEIKQTLLKQISGELPAVQEILKKNIQQLVTQSMASLETRMRAELSAEISALLQKVKFVLPE